MSSPCAWPTLAAFKRLVNLAPDDTSRDDDAQLQLNAGIEFVKGQVGEWDDVIDCPDDNLNGAALRAAFLLSLRESPASIVNDQVFATYMAGRRRRFSFA